MPPDSRVQATLGRVLKDLHPGVSGSRPAPPAKAAQPSLLAALLNKGGGLTKPRPRSRVRKRKEEEAEGGEEEKESAPSACARPPQPGAAREEDVRTLRTFSICPICAEPFPPSKLQAHIDAELAACVAADEEAAGAWDEEEGEEERRQRRKKQRDKDAPDALLPPAPPVAGSALLALGGGGGSGRRVRAAPPPPPPPSSRRRRPAAPPAWAATLAAVAPRPGRVDHYADVRVAAAAGIQGESLGIDGIAGAAAGWEVAGASGLGAGLGED